MGPLGGSLGTAKARENPRLGGPPSMGHEGERSVDIPERQVRTTDRYKRQTGKNKQLSRRGCHGIALGLPVSREVQIQATRRSCFPPNQMGKKSKSQVTPGAGKAKPHGLVAAEPEPGPRGPGGTRRALIGADHSAPHNGRGMWDSGCKQGWGTVTGALFLRFVSEVLQDIRGY